MQLLDRGFTGHEHLPEFGLINMNGRLYDPVIARFLAPDPYVSAPESMQGYNRYSYCLNNPLKYTDPSGEWVQLVVLAAVNGLMNTMINCSQQNGNVNFGQIVGYFTVGALSSLAGGGVGQAVGGALGTIGFVGGSLTAASGGFVGGLIGGTGNALINGAGLNDALRMGVLSGVASGVTAGLLGGVMGGIDAVKHGGKFWSGEGAVFESVATTAPSSNKVEIGESMEYSYEYAKEFSDGTFPKNFTKGVSELHVDGSFPPTANYTQDGDLVLNENGKVVNGAAYYKGTGRKSAVYLYKSAFTSKEKLFFTMGHEYLHTAYVYSSSEMRHAANRAKIEHAAIYEWQYKQAKLWDFPKAASYGSRFNDYKSYYNSVYHHSNFGLPLFEQKPWLKIK